MGGTATVVQQWSVSSVLGLSLGSPTLSAIELVETLGMR